MKARQMGTLLARVLDNSNKQFKKTSVESLRDNLVGHRARAFRTRSLLGRSFKILYQKVSEKDQQFMKSAFVQTVVKQRINQLLRSRRDVMVARFLIWKNAAFRMEGALPQAYVTVSLASLQKTIQSRKLTKQMKKVFKALKVPSTTSRQVFLCSVLKNLCHKHQAWTLN